MEKELITYDTIYEALRKEKYVNELQKLDKDFYKNVTNYLKEKREIVENNDKDSMFSSEMQKTRKQIENTMKMIKELYDKREAKIIQLAIFSAKSNSDEGIDNVLDEELEMYHTFKENLMRYRKGIIDNVLECKEPCIISKELKHDENKAVRFIKPVPQFVGEDNNVYGPFDEDNIANLPERAAELLLKNKRVEEI